MNFQIAEFKAAYGRSTQIPESVLPEIVFSGKSNVGKSSLINKLLCRKSMARVSAKPGKTATINFFSLKEADLVDLPGYGFSKLSKQEQVNMGKFIEDYLQKSKNISLIVMLLDIRHNPTNDDVMMLDYIKRTNLPYILICNKADKIAPTKVNAEVDRIKEYLGLSFSTIIPFSAERRIYSDKAWEEIESFLQ